MWFPILQDWNLKPGEVLNEKGNKEPRHQHLARCEYCLRLHKVLTGNLLIPNATP